MSNDSATGGEGSGGSGSEHEPKTSTIETNESETESNSMETESVGSAGESATTSATSTNKSSSSEESEPISSTDTRRRVKLYMLNANRTWDDRGTGHVSSSYIDRLNGMSLLVKAETDGSTLLESRILADTAYQKQQDTLIVWSEGDNYDLALSFQERVGCEEIWEKICKVQGKDPSVDITQDLIEDDDNDLPPVEVSRLDEINSIIASSLTIQSKKEGITIALENENYIQKLLQLFRQLEERRDLASLQKLYEIFKNIFLLNKSSLFDIMLSESALWDVIGVFEYDPTGAIVRESLNNSSSPTSAEDERSGGQSPQPRSTTPSIRSLSSNANSYFSSLPESNESELMRLVREKRHRAFLRNVSRFKEVIPMAKSELVSKIHQTYRVQYIQDVILPTPSVFEENMLSALSSVLFFNKIEIVNLILDDDKFLKQLFNQLSDNTPSFNEKRRDLVLFLKELCTFSHTLQNRETFVKTLSSNGLLQTIELLLSSEDTVIKLGAVDILTYIVDYSPSMVREYALQQEINSDRVEQYMINIIIEQMICDNDPDLGMATQLSSILKLLIDPENMLTTSGMNKTEKSEFLNYFYKHCIGFLTAPILAPSVTSENNTDCTTECTLGFEQSCQLAQLLAIILELLTFCIEHHAYHIRSYLLQRQIIRRIMVLTKSKHTFLVLTVIRFMRRLIGLKDEFYNRHIVTGNLFAPIVDAFLLNKGRYNLLDSAVIDLFEFIHTNNIHTLSNYTMENFWKGKLERINYVRTFRCIRTFYEQQNIRERIESQTLMFSRNRFRRDPRQLDKEEDMWFNADDDEEDDEGADDDDDDECENYHEDDEDSPPPGSNRLSINDSSHHFYGASSTPAGGGGGLQKTQTANTGGVMTSPLHHSLHHSLASLHHQQVSSTTTSLSSYQNNQTTSTTSISSSTSSTSSSTIGGSHHFSNYDTSSPFIDSPLFSSFSSSGKKKSNERKTLTINLNSKSPLQYLACSNNSSSPNTTTNVLSAFSSGLCGTSNIAITSNHHSSSLFVSKSFATNSTPSSFTSSSTTSSSSALVNQSFQSCHSRKEPSVLSRKALVDYPDEDSDEEDEEEEENEDEEGVAHKSDTSRLRVKISTSTSSSSKFHSSQSPNSTNDTMENAETNPVVNSSESFESAAESECTNDTETHGDDENSQEIQSRRLSSCDDMPSRGKRSNSLYQQHFVSSSKAESVSSSFNTASLSATTCSSSGGDEPLANVETTAATTTTTGKRRLSDDESKVSMSDENICTGSSDESSSSISSDSSNSSSSSSSFETKRFRNSFVESDSSSSLAPSSSLRTKSTAVPPSSLTTTTSSSSSNTTSTTPTTTDGNQESDC